MTRAAAPISCSVLTLFCFSLDAVGQTSGYGWAFWPELAVYTRLRSSARLQFAGQSRKGEDYSYKQQIGRAKNRRAGTNDSEGLSPGPLEPLCARAGNTPAGRPQA